MKPQGYCISTSDFLSLIMNRSKVNFFCLSQAVEELRMINDGDSVLVNLLCDNSSALLHTLHQLQLHSSTKGVHFSISALTLTDDHPTLQALGVQAVPVLAGIVSSSFSILVALKASQCHGAQGPLSKKKNEATCRCPLRLI